ncbi:hypothetical protein ACOMHN_035052 [Nucella lapillus]
MPHTLSNMAEYYRESAKTSAKGRKTHMMARKGSPKHHRGTGALQFNNCSPGRTTPAGSEMNRHDFFQQVQSLNWPADWEIDLHFVSSSRSQAEFQDISGQSPPKIDVVRPTAGFQLAPAPASLPRPPSSWTAADDEESTVVCSDIPDQNIGSILSNQLKMLLKVQG